MFAKKLYTHLAVHFKILRLTKLPSLFVGFSRQNIAEMVFSESVLTVIWLRVATLGQEELDLECLVHHLQGLGGLGHLLRIHSCREGLLEHVNRVLSERQKKIGVNLDSKK